MTDKRQADRRDEDDRRQADRRSEDDRRQANRTVEDGGTGPTRPPWHLDKKVPIGIIVAGFITAASMFGAARDAQSSLADHDKKIAVLEAQRLNERLSILESQMLDTRASLQRIEAKLDRLVEAKRDRL